MVSGYYQEKGNLFGCVNIGKKMYLQLELFLNKEL